MEKNQEELILADGTLRHEGLRRLCLAAGVDDAGVVELGRPGSLAYGPNYQCNHCQAVCPAGDQSRAEFEADRQAFFRNVVKPLIDRPQTVYVIEGSPAETKARANPKKEVKLIQKRRR